MHTYHSPDVRVRSHVQGAVPKAVLGRDACPLLQQLADDLLMPPAAGQVQGPVLVLPSGVDPGPVFEEQGYARLITFERLWETGLSRASIISAFLVVAVWPMQIIRWKLQTSMQELSSFKLYMFLWLLPSGEAAD
jgi:hypothetical protein